MKIGPLFVVYNEDGDVTADADRDTALERMTDEFGGREMRVFEIFFETPPFVDVTVNISLPEIAPQPADVEITT